MVAPDGSDVRILLQLSRGGMAHFELGAGQVSRAVAHHCLSIPAGTHFQFRAASTGPLAAVGATMPPWPGTDEANEVPGAWPADP